MKTTRGYIYSYVKIFMAVRVYMHNR